MTPVPSKLYSDDVSLVVVLLDTNPFFWTASSSLPFSQFLSHVMAFVNSILLLNQLNQVVVIASGYNTCDYIYDSSSDASQLGPENGKMPSLYSNLLQKLEDFMIKDERLGKEQSQRAIKSTLLSGALSMALCCILHIQRVFRSGPFHPQPRVRQILCLQGSPDGPEQYVAVMNAIFSAQRSMVPIDSCYVGAHNSAFLQQASYITGGVYVKPQHLDGLFQYLTTVFATDLHSRSFIQLPRPAGVDFRASGIPESYEIMGYSCYERVCYPFTRSKLLGVFAIKPQLIWATYALYVCPYSAIITRSVRLVVLEASSDPSLFEMWTALSSFLFGFFTALYANLFLNLLFVTSLSLLHSFESGMMMPSKRRKLKESVFGQAQSDTSSASDLKRKAPET
ncbi:hypothetical protein SADUNF_Sadunf05G0127000 [Salix dunnii]|uniref:General transcription and DNA repair factor IIH subunit TFB4 n=1 Tax=Salix dunnii TaxID=1413687 RepID=A0A835MXK1_9ROSI|nr:hypothetical protein SADUNF_Sadunf05G0127000 [Salix dunnii]